MKVQDFKPRPVLYAHEGWQLVKRIGSFQGEMCRWSGCHVRRKECPGCGCGFMVGSKVHGWDENKANLFMASQLHFSFLDLTDYHGNFHSHTNYIHKSKLVPHLTVITVGGIWEISNALTKINGSVRFFPFPRQTLTL